MKRSLDTRNNIMTSTIEVMHESESLDDITIRSIAKKAGVGIGLINYHFQTKENLVNVSVRHFIGSIIATWPNQIQKKPKSATKLLIAMLESCADFLADYPRISRISIQYDHLNPSSDDNTQQTIEGILPVLQLHYESKADANKLNLLAGQIVSSLQMAFMRSNIHNSKLGFDFFDKSQRDSFIEAIVVQLLPLKNDKQQRYLKRSFNKGKSS